MWLISKSEVKNKNSNCVIEKFQKQKNFHIESEKNEKDNRKQKSNFDKNDEAGHSSSHHLILNPISTADNNFMSKYISTFFISVLINCRNSYFQP